MKSDMSNIIYVFGNSHVSHFTGQDTIIKEHPHSIPCGPGEFNFHILRLGPSTAYNFFWNPGYYPRVLKELEEVCPEKDAYVSLLLGEIDCRVHIGRQADTSGRPLEECVEEVVDRLFLCYLDLKQKGYTPLVFAVQPPADVPPSVHPDCPVYGGLANRNRITRLFNTTLERKCKIHSIPYCSIFDELMEDEIHPKQGLFMDYVHMKGSKVRPYYDQALRKLLNNAGSVKVE
jgi:hypothetical protein